jgi:hypothetical protein
MRCKHVQERLLESRLKGERDLPEGLAPHLEKCDDCREDYEHLRVGVAALQHVLPVDPPRGMKGRIFDRLADERSREPWRVRALAFVGSSTFQWTAAAVVMLAAVSVTAILSQGPSQVDMDRDIVADIGPTALRADGQSLLDREWVASDPETRAALAEALDTLEGVAALGTSPSHSRLAAAAAHIRSTRLVERIATAMPLAPAADRQLIRDIHDGLVRVAGVE